MITCGSFGKAAPSGNSFCFSCGATLPAPGPASGPADGAVVLARERTIPLITNPYLVLPCIAIPVGLGLVFGAVFRRITGAEDMQLLFAVLGGLMALVVLCVTAVLPVVTGGGLLTAFFIGPGGVAHRAGSVTRTPGRAAAAGPVLMGSVRERRCRPAGIVTGIQYP